MAQNAVAPRRARLGWRAITFVTALTTAFIVILLLLPLWLHQPSPVQAIASPRELAVRDFERVKNGLTPDCQSVPDHGYSDGGTLVYECGHYQLTVMKSLTTSNGVDGYLYGPVIKFDSGESQSDLRFYTAEELSILLASKDGL